MGVLDFIFGIFLILLVAGCHRRWLEYRLKQQFLEDRKEDSTIPIMDESFYQLNRKED